MFQLFFLIHFVFSSQSISSNQLEKLSQDAKWKALLHYRSSTFGPEKSEISSPDFFLSTKGQYDASAELIATIEEMNKPIGEDLNQHAQCRFPARHQWLKKVLPEISSNWKKIHCPHFLAFNYNESIESVSVIFATGYLSNPASYFGHPLIKFNLSRDKMPSSLLDVSVNYGAVTPAKENPFVYAAKGLFGGYHATFSHRHFYYNNHAYGEIELRDMWEYQLNLNPEEVRYFYSHVWEVLGKKFPYYFFSDNCASAISQLIDDVLGVRLIPLLVPYSAPYTVFDSLIHKKRSDGTPLVYSVQLIPSRQTRLISRFNSLTDSEKRVVKKVVSEGHATERLKELNTEMRTNTIETLFDYYSFRSIIDSPSNGLDSTKNQLAKVKQELLIERLKLPASKNTSNTNYNLKPPHEGPRPLLTRLGYANSTQYGQGLELQFRATYYDLLALDYGRAKNTEVRTLDTTLNYIDNKLWLRKFDIIAVSTLNISQTGLPGDGGWAWHFVTGLETLNLSCQDCLLYKIEAGYGKAFLLHDRQVFYMILDARLQTLTEDSETAAMSPRAGFIIDWMNSGLIKTELSMGYRSYLGNQSADSALFKAETRLNIHRNWDLRLAYDKHQSEISRLSFSYYW